MNSKSNRSILRNHVRDEIAVCLEQGGGRAREIARTVCTKHADLIDELGGQLAEDSVTRIVHNEIKRWGAVGSAEREQLVMPGMEVSMARDLPASISVPSPEGDDGDPIYRPLFGPNGATVGELRLAIDFLWKGITADQRKAQALSHLLVQVIATGAGNETSVSEAFQTHAGAPA